MNKNDTMILLILSALAAVAGYLLSAISFVGRVGIGLFYHQYRFLKVWWKGALIVFMVWLLVWLLQSLLRKKVVVSTMDVLHSIFLIIALAGLYFSFIDFRHTLSHRWLGERFHLGVYLFWVGWIGLTIYVWLKPGMRNNSFVQKGENSNIHSSYTHE